MKYLESFNNNYTSEQMDNINDICLELEDLDLQYRIIVSTADYGYSEFGPKYVNHLFTDWDWKEAKHSKSEEYEKNMTIEIYDRYDVCSGGGCEGGDIKVTKEFWSTIMRLKEYLNTDITIGVYHSEDYFQISYDDFEPAAQTGHFDEFEINQIDINTLNDK